MADLWDVTVFVLVPNMMGPGDHIFVRHYQAPELRNSSRSRHRQPDDAGGYSDGLTFRLRFIANIIFIRHRHPAQPGFTAHRGQWRSDLCGWIHDSSGGREIDC